MKKPILLLFIVLLLGILSLPYCSSPAVDMKELAQPSRYLDSTFKEIRIDKAVFYGPNIDQQWMQVYQPEGDRVTNRPLVILFPGGGFDPDQINHSYQLLVPLAKKLAHHGYVAALANYSTQKVHTPEEYRRAYMTALIDLKTCLAYFQNKIGVAEEYQIDPARIFTIGWSAGAQIGLFNAFARTKDELSIEESLVYQMVLDQYQLTPYFTGNNKIMGHISLAGSMADLERIDTKDPALLCIHSDTDFTVRIDSQHSAFGMTYGSIPLIKRASEQGLPSELFVIPNGTHTAPMKTIDCPDCNDIVIQFLYRILFPKATSGRR